MEFLNCPWCDQRNPQANLECRKCGGPLPTLAGNDPGPRPPLPPRTLPAGYKRRILFTHAPLTLVGAIFILVGFPLGVVFTIVGLIPPMFLFIPIGGGIGGLFTLLGGVLLYLGIKQGLSKIRPFEQGQATEGEIVDLYRDTSIRVNGRSPWAVIYTFDVYGNAYEGKVFAWKQAGETIGIGNRVHVLYMPDDPGQSVIYPPVV